MMMNLMQTNVEGKYVDFCHKMFFLQCTCVLS